LILSLFFTYEPPKALSYPIPLSSLMAKEKPFTQGPYTLHNTEVTLKGGRKQRLFFFAKNKPKRGTPCAKPDGYSVGKNKRTGLPFLKKKK
jgi:hypothetical protein